MRDEDQIPDYVDPESDVLETVVEDEYEEETQDDPQKSKITPDTVEEDDDFEEETGKMWDD